MSRLLHYIEKLMADGADILKAYRKETLTYYVPEMSKSAGTQIFTMLISASDQMVADPALTIPKIGKRRVVRKVPDEGQDFSAHVVISLVAKTGDPDTYLMLVEQAPQVGSLHVQRYLNFLFRLCARTYESDFSENFPDGSKRRNGQPRVGLRRHKIELYGHPSQELLADLSGGALTAIDLITESERNTGWDTQGFVVERRKVIELRPRARGGLLHATDVVKSVLRKAKKADYEFARVKFKTNRNLYRSALLSTGNNIAAADDMYVKKAIIRGFSESLPTSLEKIHPEIDKKFRRLLTEERQST